MSDLEQNLLHKENENDDLEISEEKVIDDKIQPELGKE